MADQELTPFEGKRVVSVGIEMPNAAGGLQAAMKFDPLELHHGDEGYIVLHYRTEKVRFDPLEKGTQEPLRRVQILHVDGAAPIAAEYVEEKLKEYQAHVAKLEKEAEGQNQIPGVDPDADRDAFQRMTPKALKELCKAQDPPLSQAGSKADLIQRLIDNGVTAPEPNDPATED